jgi:hypothetical protein
LHYEAVQDETRYLVVDSADINEAGDFAFDVDIRRTGPFPMVLQPNRYEVGSDPDVTVTCTLEPCGWTTSNPVFSTSGSLLIAEQVIVDDTTATLTFNSRGGGNLATGSFDLEVTTDTGTATAPDSLTIDKFVFSDSCSFADSISPLVPGRTVGATGFSVPSGLTAFPCTQDGFGPEGIHRVILPGGHTLRATVDSQFDSVLYVVDACPGDVVTCADLGVTGRPEYIEWVAPAEGAEVYLVVDGFDFDDSGTYTLDVEITP